MPHEDIFPHITGPESAEHGVVARDIKLMEPSMTLACLHVLKNYI